MNKLTKKICGSLICDLFGDLGNVDLHINNDSYTGVTVDYKHLNNFIFCIKPQELDEVVVDNETVGYPTTCDVSLYVVPKSVKDFVFEDLDKWCKLVFSFPMDTETCLCYTDAVTRFSLFIDELNRHYKYFFYTSVILPNVFEKYPKRSTINKFYRTHKPVD